MKTNEQLYCAVRLIYNVILCYFHYASENASGIGSSLGPPMEFEHVLCLQPGDRESFCLTSLFLPAVQGRHELIPHAKTWSHFR